MPTARRPFAARTGGFSDCLKKGPCAALLALTPYYWGQGFQRELDHRTLAKSGQLPLAFLRGCGLPDKLIDYLPSLLNEAIQFYSCFIAYDHTDKDFARRLYDTLQGRGIRCWLDEKQLRPGDDIHEEVDRGIRLWDKVLSRRTTLCSKTARSLSRPWRPSDHLNQCRL